MTGVLQYTLSTYDSSFSGIVQFLNELFKFIDFQQFGYPSFHGSGKGLMAPSVLVIIDRVVFRPLSSCDDYGILEWGRVV